MEVELVYALALVPAVLWGFSPILSKRGMAGGGSSLQASLTVVVVDSSLYWVALFALQGLAVFASVTPASAALFLASDDSGFVTGEAIVVDGGLTAAGPNLSLRQPHLSARNPEVSGVTKGTTGEPPDLRRL